MRNINFKPTVRLYDALSDAYEIIFQNEVQHDVLKGERNLGLETS